jgi:hypothetical protein
MEDLDSKALRRRFRWRNDQFSGLLGRKTDEETPFWFLIT